MIVFADADPAVAIPAIAYGIFYNMGQTCTAGTRLYVHKDIADTILTGLKAFAEGMSIGVGLIRRRRSARWSPRSSSIVSAPM